jgi:glutaminase
MMLHRDGAGSLGARMNKAFGVQPVVSAEAVAALAPVEDYLAELHERVSALTSGKPADYIPELCKADPSHFGIALATIDGEVLCRR